MKKILVLIALFLSASCYGQHPNKPRHPEIIDSACSTNIEWYYDTSYSKHYIPIELDAIEFFDWVIENYERAGVMWEGKSGSGKSVKHIVWKLKNKELKGWDLPLTTKELWLVWFKEVNECWWE